MSVEVAVTGSGGREDVIAQELVASESVDLVGLIPGNAGVDFIPGAYLPGVSLEPESEELRQYAKTFTEPNGDWRHRDLDLLVVGPEQHLVDGVADRARSYGVDVFGPSAEGAQVEGSKAWSDEFMKAAGVPHPESKVFDNRDTAIEYLKTRYKSPQEFVIKADGLAAGKGAILPDTWEEAYDTVGGMLSGDLFGAAGEKIVVQERLHGPEVSMFIVMDGDDFVVLPFTQDHKRIGEGDTGPNTGGMGAYTIPGGTVISERQKEMMYEIAEKSVAEMCKRGIDYRGVLYAGLMLAEELDGDPVVIEYNARFGDPEVQAVLPLLRENGIDPYEFMKSAAVGSLAYTQEEIDRIKGHRFTVALASPGYPEKAETGDVIHGLHKSYPNVVLNFAGVKVHEQDMNKPIEQRRYVTGGGRVLYLTGRGETLEEAAQNTYAAIGQHAVHFGSIEKGDMQYRRDIGWQVLKPTA